MQQFARRQPNEPENDPPKAFEASNEVVAQFMDQVCSLQQHVIALQEEVAGIKGENQRLRSQIAAWVANQEAYLGGKPVPQEPEVQAEPASQESTTSDDLAPQEVVAETPPLEAIATEAEEPPAQTPIEEMEIDEESFIEQARSVEVPPAAKPEPTDDEIQRMLADVAATAQDANPSPIEEVATELHEVEEAQEPEPFLHLAEEPIEEPATTISFEIDREAVKRVPSQLAIAALAVPVRLEADAVVCKAVAPFDHASLDLIADAIASRVIPEAAPIEEVVAALRIAYNDEQYSDEREEVWAVSGATKKRGLFRRSA